MFSIQGHKDYFVATVISYISSLHDLYYLWKIQVVRTEQLRSCETNNAQIIELDPWQLAVVKHLDNTVKLRDKYYSSPQTSFSAHVDNDLESDNESDHDIEIDNITPSSNSFDSNCQTAEEAMQFQEQQEIQWQKPMLIVGKAGSGKSQTISHCVDKHLRKGKNIFVLAPTRLLASHFRSSLPSGVDCDTVHAAFHIPVGNDEQPKTNWALSHYDIVIIDEISMVSEKYFAHILETLNRINYRPILVVCGDMGQQQPFEKVGGYSIVTFPLNNSRFTSSTYRFSLNGQHRVDDEEYVKILDHLRNWRPDQNVLNKIQEGRVICEQRQIIASKLLEILLENPEATVLTFTNDAAAHVNNLIL